MPFDIDCRDADFRRDPERPGVQPAPGATTTPIVAVAVCASCNEERCNCPEPTGERA